MSTFVVQLIGRRAGEWQGRAVHVHTGEEIRFGSIGELLEFFEGLDSLGEIDLPGSASSRRKRKGWGAARRPGPEAEA